MPKKSRGKTGKEGDESGGTKTKSKKMSKFDMLKAEVGEEETEETETVAQEVKKTKKPKKIVGDPGYRPKDHDEDLEVSEVFRYGYCPISYFLIDFEIKPRTWVHDPGSLNCAVFMSYTYIIFTANLK